MQSNNREELEREFLQKVVFPSVNSNAHFRSIAQKYEEHGPKHRVVAAALRSFLVEHLEIA